MCTFDGALRWIAVPWVGPPPRRSLAGQPLAAIYIFSADTDDLSITNSLWHYSQGEWRLLATIDPPLPRFACSLNVFHEKLVVSGGQNATLPHSNLAYAWYGRIQGLHFLEVQRRPHTGASGQFANERSWTRGYRRRRKRNLVRPQCYPRRYTRKRRRWSRQLSKIHKRRLL
jgi:hypothetical protein